MGEAYIVPAGCRDDQGIMGAVKLGLNALAEGEGIFSPHGGGIRENMV